LTFKCPTCAAECTVDDKFKGRKLRCPKCKCKVLHLPDGRMEVLKPGQPLPASAQAAPGAQEESTAAIPFDALPGTDAAAPPQKAGFSWFTSQSESRQNAVILGAIALVAIVAVLVLVSLSENALIMALIVTAVIGATAIGLLSHAKAAARRQAAAAAASPAAGAKKEDDETQPMPSSTPGDKAP
jgi:DNA-directed RNA polymerase subunit RPC12/RpoP